MAEIINFFANQTVTLILFGYIAVLWVALIFWTALDVFSRSQNWLVRISCIVLSIFGFVFGFALYLIIRPQHTLGESKMHELEERLLEKQAQSFVCPKCQEVVREDFLFCTNCGYQVKKTCLNCTRAVEIVWQACPYCGASIAPSLPAAAVKELPAPKKTNGLLTGLFNLFSAKTVEGEVRRGRGRPRKNPPEIKVAKRPRGRPRKNDVVTPTSKRGRGRPPKTTFPSA